MEDRDVLQETIPEVLGRARRLTGMKIIAALILLLVSLFTCSPAHTAGGGAYSTVFNGKLWIYGGKTGTTYEQADDVWFMSRS